MEQWYTLHTKPRKERQVRDYLDGRGIRTYLPAVRVPNRRYPREKREEPFFARYLFAHLDLTQVALSSLNWAPGVTSLVSFGGQPAVVPEQVIQWLQGRLAQNEVWGYRGVPLQANDRVRFVDGPLRGMEAIFDCRLSAEDRARVFVELLGRLTACEIPLRWLERI